MRLQFRSATDERGQLRSLVQALEKERDELCAEVKRLQSGNQECIEAREARWLSQQKELERAESAAVRDEVQRLNNALDASNGSCKSAEARAANATKCLEEASARCRSSEDKVQRLTSELQELQAYAKDASRRAERCDALEAEMAEMKERLQRELLRRSEEISLEQKLQSAQKAAEERAEKAILRSEFAEQRAIAAEKRIADLEMQMAATTTDLTNSAIALQARQRRLEAEATRMAHYEQDREVQRLRERVVVQGEELKRLQTLLAMGGNADDVAAAATAAASPYIGPRRFPMAGVEDLTPRGGRPQLPPAGKRLGTPRATRPSTPRELLALQAPQFSKSRRTPSTSTQVPDDDNHFMAEFDHAYVSWSTPKIPRTISTGYSGHVVSGGIGLTGEVSPSLSHAPGESYPPSVNALFQPGVFQFQCEPPESTPVEPMREVSEPVAQKPQASPPMQPPASSGLSKERTVPLMPSVPVRGQQGVTHRHRNEVGLCQEPAFSTMQLEQCIAQCQKEVEAIAAKCRDGQKFNDPDFPAAKTSLFSSLIT
eukprot:symbB.v1.2.022441.t1/scaffold1940.1/size95532/7